MAKIIGKNRALETKAMFCARWMIICYAVAAVALLTFILNRGSQYLSHRVTFLLIVVIGICSWLGHMFRDMLAMYNSGLDGEKSAEVIVSKLPDTYRGFRNLRVTYGGQTSELDMVVTGPTGVFVIETKNMNGTIVGNYGASYWTQRKVGRKGTPYSEDFYSPVKQVKTHVYRLANYLRDRYIFTYVETMVYFSNSASVVHITGDPAGTPVFTALDNGPEAIRNHILSAGSKLYGDKLAKINGLLEELAD